MIKKSDMRIPVFIIGSDNSMASRVASDKDQVCSLNYAKPHCG